MLNQKTSEHVSKLNLNGNSLPPSQNSIILQLAKKEPQTINETAKNLSKDYHSIHRSLESLENKKLVRKVDVKKYRGNEFHRYWLTDEGIIAAMLGGADKELLLKRTRELFPEANIVHCFLEITQHMNPLMMTLANNLIKNKGKLELIDLMMILVSDAVFEVDVETMKSIVSVLKKYPDEYVKMKILIQAIIEKLSQLIAD